MAIKSRITGKILFEAKAPTIKAELEIAVGKRANLRGADLCGANLGGANLRGANLREANLREANLWGADLWGAKIKNVKWPAPPMILLANWFKLSNKLMLDLMRYDAFNHPNPKAFLDWANGGACPYDSLNIQRSANFRENRELIKRGFLQRKPKSAYELMQQLLTECCKEE